MRAEPARLDSDARTPSELRAGVARAVEALGTGLISHSKNDHLRRKLESGELSAQDCYRQLVSIVYRLLFLFVAEGRGLLHPREADERACDLYEDEYSARRLSLLAATNGCPKDAELWRGFSLVTAALGRPEGSPELGLPGLGSFLWSRDAAADLLGPAEATGGAPVQLRDDDLLAVVRVLGDYAPEASPSAVEGKQLCFEHLGSVYEYLLELVPDINLQANTFSLQRAAGSERKTSGSYYTPHSLIEHLLDSALDPVIEERLDQAIYLTLRDGTTREASQEAAILGITVCDPTGGAGHFLVAAARRLAGRLARIRSGSLKPARDVYQQSLGEVIRCCIYGVDINPMAAELCRLALWVESNDPGAPLALLARRIRVGNSLLGTTPELLANGVPDDAFQMLAEDDKQAVAYYKRRNRRERLILASQKRASLNGTARSAGRTARSTDPSTLARCQFLADAWCAAFVWRKHDTASAKAVANFPGNWDAITERLFRSIEQDPGSVPPWIRDEVLRLAGAYQFFHWHLEFPEIYGWPDEPPATGRQDELPTEVERFVSGNGFDAIVGNPPFLNQLESATATEKGCTAIVRQRTGCGIRGYTDVSAAFMALSTRLVKPGGRVALVQPQSLLAAKDASPVRTAVLRRGCLTSLWVSDEHVFPGVGVFTCAPTIHVDGPRLGRLARSASGRFRPLDSIDIDNDALMEEETWAHLAAAASGIPELDVWSDRTIGDIADATADFRDQYYGLDGFLVEDEEVTRVCRKCDQNFPPVVTAGLVDLAECRWGATTTRILKQKWSAPRVDRRRMERDGTLGPWIALRLVPKVLIATQTRVIEPVVDEAGRYVPSTPLISVMPRDADQLWRVAAALASPVCTAIGMQKYAGAALNASALKLSAKQVLALPLPTDEPAWDLAALSFKAAQEAATPDARTEHLLAMALASCDAYRLAHGCRETLLNWWRERLKARARVHNST